MLTADPEALVSPERIEAIATQLSQTTTTSLFLAQLADVRQVAPAEKFDAASAAIDRIKQEVVPLPEGFRLTTRHFEKPKADQPPAAEIRDGALTLVTAESSSCATSHKPTRWRPWRVMPSASGR